MINRTMAVVSPAAGLLLGIADFVWIKVVPSPFGDLGNSIAVWAVAAFLLTFRSRWSLPTGIAGAILMLIVAVPAYYLAAAVIQGDDLANMWAPYALVWMALGVVAGAVFGAGGVLARTPGRWQVPARALPGSILFAEAALQLFRVGDPSYGVAGPLSYAAVLTALGLLITLMLGRGRALLFALPLTVAGAALLFATGFH